MGTGPGNKGYIAAAGTLKAERCTLGGERAYLASGTMYPTDISPYLPVGNVLYTWRTLQKSGGGLMPRAQWDQEKRQEIKDKIVECLEQSRNNLEGDSYGNSTMFETRELLGATGVRS